MKELIIALALQVNAKDEPTSFVDLAERLMSSVVNISTGTTVTTITLFKIQIFYKAIIKF